MTGKEAVLGHLPPVTVTYVTQRQQWRLRGDYVYRIRGHQVKVPDEYLTDLASVPRPLWVAIAPYELSLAAPLLHDYIYRLGGDVAGEKYTRAEADRLFVEIMAAQGVSAPRMIAAYLVVRIFGRAAWGGSDD